MDSHTLSLASCTLSLPWDGLGSRKFFRCANFHAWYESRCREVNQQLNQLHIQCILASDVAAYARDKSEVEIVDLVLNLKDKIRSLDDGSPGVAVSASQLQLQQQQRTQLAALVKSVVRLLPPDLHSILTKK